MHVGPLRSLALPSPPLPSPSLPPRISCIAPQVRPLCTSCRRGPLRIGMRPTSRRTRRAPSTTGPFHGETVVGLRALRAGVASVCGVEPPWPAFAWPRRPSVCSRVCPRRPCPCGDFLVAGKSSTSTRQIPCGFACVVAFLMTTIFFMPELLRARAPQASQCRNRSSAWLRARSHTGSVCETTGWVATCGPPRARMRPGPVFRT